MNKVQIYYLKQFLSALVGSFILFIGIWIIATMMEDLSTLLKGAEKYPTREFFLYFLYEIPNQTHYFFPIASLFSIVYTLGRANQQNELIAVYNSGTQIAFVMIPVIIFVFLGSLLIFFTDEKNYEYHMRHVLLNRKFRSGKEADLNNLKPQHDLTIFGANNKIYFIKKYEPKESIMMSPHILFFNPDYTFKTIISAKSFKYNAIDNIWTGKKVFVRHFGSNGETTSINTRESFSTNLNEKPFHFEQTRDRLDHMSPLQIKELAKKTEIIGGAVEKYWSEYYNRTAIPFIGLMVVLMGIPLSTFSRNSGIVMSLFLVLMATIAYYIFMYIGTSLGANAVLPPFIAGWLGNFVFFTGSIFLYNRLIL